jgi:hypothetical protein
MSNRSDYVLTRGVVRRRMIGNALRTVFTNGKLRKSSGRLRYAHVPLGHGSK